MGVNIDVEALDSFILEKVEEDLFSGAVLVARNGDSIFEGAYGLACKSYDIPNRINTKFNIGSLNKMFTHVAITQLLEKNRLDYNVPIVKYLPDYPRNVSSKVTINHLLKFTSGLGQYWNEKFYANMRKLKKVDDFVSLFIDEPLDFEPGERKQYSNNGFVLLGKIIETQSGLDYYDYIRENIYRPAGMKDSDHYELDIPVENLAIGYTSTNEKGQYASKIWKKNCFLIGVKGSPAGGGYSTVEDLLKFDNAFDNHILLSPEYASTILPQTSTKKNQEPRVIGRAGGASGVAAFYTKLPELGYTAIVLSNYDPPYGKVVEEKIRKMILELHIQ